MDDKQQRLFKSAPSVSTVAIESQMVLLDGHNDTFLGLNELATAIWTLLVEKNNTVLEAIEHLNTLYDVDRQRLFTDVLSFVDEMMNKQLLVSVDSCSRLPLPSAAWHASLLTRCADELVTHLLPFPWLEAHYHLRQVHRQLTSRHHGFLSFVQYLQSLPAHRIVSSEHTEVRRLSHAVKIAADWQPFQAACLHHCLALCWMLRKRGIMADVVMGVYTHPFSAHVWVVCKDEMLQWMAGMGPYPDATRLATMSVLFHTGTMRVEEKEQP